MQLKRKPTLTTKAGLLTAVSVSLSLLTGCLPAHFNPFGTPTGTTPTQVANVPVQFATIQGTVMMNGQPVANAPISVFNALNNQAAAVIASGGANVIAAGGANAIAVGAANLTTDAQGHFSVPVSGLTSGSVARIVVSSGGSTLATLVSGDGQTLAGGGASAEHVLQVAPSLNVSITPGTTAAALASASLIQMAFGFKAQAAATIIAAVMSGMSSVAQNADKFYNANPVQAAQLVSETDPNTGLPKNIQAVTTALNQAGVSTGITNVATSTLKTVAQESQDKSNVTQAVGDQTSTVVGTSLTINIAGGVATVTDPSTGTTTQIDLNPANNTGSGSTGSSNTGTTGTTGTQSQGASNSGATKQSTNTSTTGVTPLQTSSSFSPAVTLGYTGGNLTITVTQNANQDGLQYVLARVLKANVTLGTLSSNLGATASITIQGQSARGLYLSQGGTNSSANEQLYSPFGTALLTSADWSGLLHIDSTTGSALARFQIFHDSTYEYITTDYLANSGVTYTGGSTTTVSTNVLSSVTSGTYADVLMVSRAGNVVEASQKLN